MGEGVSRTAVPLEAHAVRIILPKLCFGKVGLRHDRASVFGHDTKKFLLFPHHIRTNSYKTNENNTKQTKIKQLNSWVASHEALV